MERWKTEDGKEITTQRKRPNRVVIRLSDEEYTEFQQWAASAGMSYQEYGRRALLNQTITNTDAIKELVPQLGKIGGNLNQIAKALNSTRYFDYRLITHNQKELMEIWQLLRQFLAERR